MEEWLLVCLLAVLAALLPVETAKAPDRRRSGSGPGPGDIGPQRKNGRRKLVPYTDLAAASVAAC